MKKMLLTIVAVVVICCQPTVAQDKDDSEGKLRYGRDGKVYRSKKLDLVESIVDKSLEWLVKSQNDDGSWGEDNMATVISGYNLTKVGTTGLVVLSFLGRGYTHLSQDEVDSNKVGEIVKSGIDWLSNQQAKSGLIGSEKDSDFAFNNAIATLALCEAYGMTNEEEFKENALDAVSYIVKVQDKEGGWSRKGTGSSADIFTTLHSTMALVSARISLDSERVISGSEPSGLRAIEDAFKKVVAYLKKEDKYIKEPAAALSYIYASGRKKAEPDLAKFRNTVKDTTSNLPDLSKPDYMKWYVNTLFVFQCDGIAGDYWKKWEKSLESILNTIKDPPYSNQKSKNGKISETCLFILTVEILLRY